MISFYDALVKVSEEKNRQYTGINFLQALTLLFVGLKLCGVITWAWFYVLLPYIILIFFNVVELSRRASLILLSENSEEELSEENVEPNNE